MKPTRLVLSCEHAVNTIPPEYRHLFQKDIGVLQTHRAVDFGALEVETTLVKTFHCKHAEATASRLLIECNRSLNHPHCFSEFTAPLADAEKQIIIERYYQPYRSKIEGYIETYIKEGHQVFHLSVHSFTPVLNGVTRNAAIGLLYDPKRHGEKEVAREWGRLLSQQPPHYYVRMNYPYKGISDGFVTSLRKRHPEKNYLGIELEMNQNLMKDSSSLTRLGQVISSSLKELLQVIS